MRVLPTAGTRQRHPERRAAELAVDERDVAAREQRVLLRNRQAESHAVLLERDRRLEERAAAPRRSARARIVDFDRRRAPSVAIA